MGTPTTDFANHKGICDTLGLRHGQFFAYNLVRNVWWDLNGEIIGYGDLNAANIESISEALKDGDKFAGWNEHHGSPWQQTKTPMIRIEKKDGKVTVTHRIAIIREEGR